MPEAPIKAVRYAPPPGYRLDVEIYGHDELRRRARSVGPRLERIDFHVLLYVTADGYRHLVDFESHECEAGAVLVLRPGQVHRFGDTDRFVGWLLIFRPEVLPPGGIDLSRHLEELPSHVRLPPDVRPVMTRALQQMAADSVGPPTHLRNALMTSQLHAWVLRLAMTFVEAERENIDLAVLERFHRFRAAVEERHRQWHTVQGYAKHLGCSTRSLTRAAAEVAGTSAKELITSRIVLEAKRRLVHTSDPVAAIADQLGFDEPTNFVKHFRRATGITPGAFRRRHAGT